MKKNIAGQSLVGGVRTFKESSPLGERDIPAVFVNSRFYKEGG